MKLLQQAVLDNRLLLVELNQLLSKIQQSNPKIYSEAMPLLNGVCLGGHVRHIIEHYQIFIKASQVKTTVDYDHRARCMQCQSSIIIAQTAIDEILHDWDAMPKEDGSLTVSMITNPALTDMVSSSSVLRELQFLQSHTVHHLAIMGIALRQYGFDVNGDISKAPSTLQFELNN